MNLIRFERIFDFDSTIPMVTSWVGVKYENISYRPSKNTIDIKCNANLTQQEMDTITANATSEFIKVTFSQSE